jgi:hypothetical protein
VYVGNIFNSLQKQLEALIPKSLNYRLIGSDKTTMKSKQLIFTLFLCFFCSIVWAQKYALKKSRLLAYSISLSDYSFIKSLQDSSFSKAFNPKNYFKSGNSSFGVVISYWKGLHTHIDFSANLGGTFSNFPTLFIKNDSIGQAKFSSHLDALQLTEKIKK